MDNVDSSQPLLTGPEWVAAEPFRAHVRHLVAVSGLPWPAVAVAAGLSVTMLDHLLHGRRGRPLLRISPLVAAALFVLDPHELARAARAWVPVQRTRDTLLGLLAEGADLGGLSRFSGLPRATLAAIAAGDTPGCRQRSAWLIDAAERVKLTGLSASAA